MQEKKILQAKKTIKKQAIIEQSIKLNYFFS